MWLEGLILWCACWGDSAHCQTASAITVTNLARPGRLRCWSIILNCVTLSEFTRLIIRIKRRGTDRDVVVVANSKLSKLGLRYEGSRYGRNHFMGAFHIPGAHVHRLETTREVASARRFIRSMLSCQDCANIKIWGSCTPLSHTTTYLFDIKEWQYKHL
jgi:hypothetical protein